ncbi:MAG: M1 family metallopeptidase, partial [Deltaproteobacteria bacterium]|nr:M1 family metallopeptidase [Deltaproteobacteria bacterium]
MTSTSYRLPRQVAPKAYAVDLDATPRRDTFHGSVHITAQVLSPTATVELSARDLEVKRAMLLGKKKRAGRVEMHAERETVEIVFDAPLSKGKIELVVEFAGKLNPSMHGLYLAKDGSDQAIVSQCEATDARAIFPCFDEPDRKATLAWTIRTDPGLSVVTNGVPASRRKEKGREVHRFKPTRVIASYLAAVAIGKLEATKAKRVAGVPCRIYCGPGKLKQTDFALGVTAQVLPWYQRYFGHQYNYQKLDQVAVPGFDAGAMENVGAVFYRQSLLLMQPGATSWQSEKRIAEVIAHEIAHMWFGNLVTMKWWDDLWLNEAFATWVAYKSVDLWQPHWRLWDDFLESKENALAADALVNTHPIYAEVKSPAEATELFDVITYEKGCAVLRMAERYLGEDAFGKGLRRYIGKFKNANAQGADLWDALAVAAGEPVDLLMKSWITQPGFPLVNVAPSVQNGQTMVHLSQRRFFASAQEMARPNDQLWRTPLVIRYEDDAGVHDHRLVMNGREQRVTLPGEARWVFPNADAAGFYRMRLDDRALRDLLTHGLGELTAGERATLLEDQWALVRNGLSTSERFMEVLVAFRGERDHVVTRALVARLIYLDELLVRDEERGLLAELARWLLAPQLDELGFATGKDEPPPRAVRRAAVVMGLGDVGNDAAVLSAAEREVEREMQDPVAVEPNLAGIVVQLAALRGDAKRLARYVETYLERKKKRASPELQARYLSALACFEDP